MARWLLKGKHYINVKVDGDPIEWEYKETLPNGKQKRMTLIVPMFLDPEGVGDWNSPDGIVVAYEDGKHERKDYLFTGPPTPDMEPIDDEARTITEEMKHLWVHPIDSLEGSYADRVESGLAAQMAEFLKNANQPKPVNDEVAELKAQVAELMKLLGDKPVERRV